MRVLGSGRHALTSCAAVAMLAGCGGSQPPIGGPGAIPQPSAIAAHADRGESWMKPEAEKVKELLYVSTGNDVYVFNYRTHALVGMLTGFGAAEGACVDAKGDVWFAEAGAAVEYAHGGTEPVASLSTNGYGYGCAVSPRGDLAVANTYPVSGSGLGDVQVWHGGSGTPFTYYSRRCGMPKPPGYDSQGNLYFESPPHDVCRLARGANHLQRVSFDQELDSPQGVQWDGAHLTLAVTGYRSTTVTAIYRVRELPSGDLKSIGTTVLEDQCGNNNVYQPFIVGEKNTPVNEKQGAAVVGVNSTCTQPIDFWAYAKGGEPTYAITNGPSNPQGLAVSIAP